MWHDEIACLIKFKTRRSEIDSISTLVFIIRIVATKGLNAKTIERQLDMLNVSETAEKKALYVICLTLLGFDFRNLNCLVEIVLCFEKCL